MAFRFQKRKKAGIFNITFGKKGIGISVGNKWLRGGITSDGKLYSSYRIPETGLSKVEYHTGKKKSTSKEETSQLKSISLDNLPEELDISSIVMKNGSPYEVKKVGKFTKFLLGFNVFLGIILAPTVPIFGIPFLIIVLYANYSYFIKPKRAFKDLPEEGIKGTYYLADAKYPAVLVEKDGKKILHYKLEGVPTKTELDEGSYKETTFKIFPMVKRQGLLIKSNTGLEAFVIS